ncbi:MAG TPA: hypothetical protein VKZ88_03045 [Fibrobacteria bacterium]|jgi:hypothetical protein|nr:hypothetical protein [Fibrobacteria bacterium]
MKLVAGRWSLAKNSMDTGRPRRPKKTGKAQIRPATVVWPAMNSAVMNSGAATLSMQK